MVLDQITCNPDVSLLKIKCLLDCDLMSPLLNHPFQPEVSRGERQTDEQSTTLVLNPSLAAR
jgi:hypothetical protein